MHIRTEAYNRSGGAGEAENLPLDPSPRLLNSPRLSRRSLYSQCVYVSDLRYFLPEYINAENCETDPRGAKVIYTREINCFEIWAEAWENYSIAVLLRHPGLLNDLDAYYRFIEDSSCHFSWKSVYTYDREFRDILAQDPSSFAEGWGVIDISLYERCFTLPSQRFQHVLSRVERGVESRRVRGGVNDDAEAMCTQQVFSGPYRPAKANQALVHIITWGLSRFFGWHA